MDIAVKKVELIEWLSRLQDEKLIERIESLRKASVKSLYDERMPKSMSDLEAKLDKAEMDIEAGKVYAHEDVEKYFKAKFKK